MSTFPVPNRHDKMLRHTTREISKTDLYSLIKSYNLYSNNIHKITATQRLIRKPPFPSVISENLLRLYIENREQRPCTWSNARTGDLRVLPDIKVECKCFQTTAPISFGPTAYWDEIYFLDARLFITQSHLAIYKLAHSSTSDLVRTIPINRYQTYQDQCDQMRRPRIPFERIALHTQKHMQQVYNGVWYDLIQ